MTLDQDRARDALKKAKAVSKKDEDFKKKYRSYVDRLGPSIVMNGLGQALATEIAAKGSPHADANEDAHAALIDNLENWLCREEGGVFPGAHGLLDAIVGNPEERYLHAQAETLKWLEWHKKFCRAFLPEPDSGGRE